VPNLGQNIKPNISKLRETPTHTSNQQKKITKKEDPGALIIPSRESLSRQSGRLGVGQPDYNEIKTYFEQNKYPSSEAKKFYNHYKSLGWKIQGKAPIEDWRALVEKWMVNARHWPGQQEKIPEQDIGKEIQYLYESWKEGKTIMHHLSEKHFHHLQLQLTPEIEQTAKAERIKQLSSSNQHRDLQLLMAYTSNQLDKEIILKDHSNIELIAKRIAIIYHFINTQQHEH
ncbi:MAG: hypothetical protein GXC73_18990, partial [Chitinophagaceae bacterium]|nr:hypothetical protein [Chitinophagaceae bacterium]